jgi:hypothetical protein
MLLLLLLLSYAALVDAEAEEAATTAYSRGVVADAADRGATATDARGATSLALLSPMALPLRLLMEDCCCSRQS